MISYEILDYILVNTIVSVEDANNNRITLTDIALFILEYFRKKPYSEKMIQAETIWSDMIYNILSSTVISHSQHEFSLTRTYNQCHNIQK